MESALTIGLFVLGWLLAATGILGHLLKFILLFTLGAVLIGTWSCVTFGVC